MNKVAIIIPAYYEEAVIFDVVSGLRKTLKKEKLDAEVVVVNDGSTDKTAEMAKKAGAKVISHIINQGAGAATSTGLRYAKENGFDYAATMDADGQHSPIDVINCIKDAERTDADLLIGSRLINAEGMSRTKIIGNKGLSFGTWLLFGVKCSDSQSGLRVFSKKALQQLEWQSTRYEFCSEMLWRAKQAKLKITEYPIRAIYTDYSENKASGQNTYSNWNGVNIVKALIKMKVKEILG